jgi:hypothetical protein
MGRLKLAAGDGVFFACGTHEVHSVLCTCGRPSARDILRACLFGLELLSF